MKNRIGHVSGAVAVFITINVLMTSCSVEQPQTSPAQSTLAYPETKRIDHVDVYHGTEVPDPYRWLEQDGAETKAWIEAQNALAQPILEAIPAREQIKKRMTQD